MVRSGFKLTLMFHLLIVGAGMLALTGCSNDDDAAPAASTTATASLGLIQNATVNFYRADGSTLIGTGDTGSSGSVTVPATGYSGPVIIEVLGDADATYFDESAGSAIAFGAGQKMRAVIAAPGGAVAVTPLTELAYQAAANAGQIPITAAQADAANEAVRAALAPGLSSILSVPTSFDASTTSGSLTDTEAGRYALILAALAELASGDASPALTVLQALVADAADGQIDGQANGSSVSAPYSNFISDMETALGTMASSYGNSALQSSAASQKPASTSVQTTQGGSGDGPNGVTRAATVHANLQAQYTLKVTSSQPGSPYSDGETYLVIVGSDNSLTIGDGPALSDPFERQIGNSFNTAEVIWLDETHQLEYALSNNSTGSFNEINIGDAANPQAANGIPGFLGQMVIDNGGGSGPDNIELVQALAGSYSVSEVQEGSHTRNTVTISSEGVVDYDDGIRIAIDEIDAVYDRLACCNRITIETTADGSGPRIDLFVDEQGALIEVEYFTAGLGSDGSKVTVTSGDGGGSVDPEQNNTGKSRVTGKNGFTGVIDGTEYSFLGSTSVLPNNSGDGILRIDGIDPNNGNTRWRLFVPGIPGTYSCAETAEERVLQFIHNGGFGASNGSATGEGSCSIKLTRNDSGIVEGYFVGELKDAVNDPLKTVTDGYFYINSNEEQTGALAAGQRGMQYTVGGQQFLVEGGAIFENTFDNMIGVNLGPGGSLTQFFNLPNELGTYRCGEGPRAFRFVNLSFHHQSKRYRAAESNSSAPAGSSCTVELTQVGTVGNNYSGTAEASFSGTFIAEDGSTLEVSNGFFRASNDQ